MTVPTPLDVPTDVGCELAALAALVHTGPPDAREQFYHSVIWNPAGVILEQALADLTLVYSLPKVGGTAAEYALVRHPAVRPEPIHIHFMAPSGLEHLSELVAANGHNQHAFAVRAQLALSHAARARLAGNRALRAAGAPARKPFVVAGTREPVAMHLSLVFEGWWQYAERFEDITPDLARSLILDTAWRAPWVNWFDDELRAVFGLDAFATPFDRARGWQVYDTDEVRAVVFRQENMSAVPDALGALYGLPSESFALGSENAAENKDYAAHYAAVRRAVRFTDAELEELYAPRFVGHFYSPTEIEAFKARWRVGAPEPERPRRATTPACAKPTEPSTEPHIAVCRPCWKCKADLVRLPHFEHRCAVQAARLDQLEAALAARGTDPLPQRSLFVRLLRRLRRMVRHG